MQAIDTVSSSILADFLRESLTGNLQNLTNEKSPFEKWLEKFKEEGQSFSSVVDKDTLLDLADGKYDISLEQYTDMHTYNLMMSNLYGNSSANVFQSSLSNMLGMQENSLATAKTFVDIMRERGLNNSSALKLYTALKSYSAMSSLSNFNFIDAKI